MTDSTVTTRKDEGLSETGGTVRAQLGPLLSLTSIFLLNFTGRIIFGPIMPAIEGDLRILHTDAGSLFLALTVGYILSILCSGFICSHITHRNTIILSAISMGVGLIVVSFSKNLIQMRLSLFLLGLSTGFYFPSGFSTLTSLVSTEHVGKAIAVHELAPNLSFVMAPFVAELFLKWFTWRYCILLLGILSILMGINYFFNCSGGDFYGHQPNFKALGTLIRSRKFIILLILFAVAVGANIGVYSMLPLYLVAAKGLERSWANSVIGFARVPGLAMSFISGLISDRLGPRRTIMIVLVSAGVVTITLGFAPLKWIAPLIFIQSALAVCFFPPGFAALASVGDRRFRNLTISFQVPFAYLFGTGIFPLFAGMLGDAGLFDWGIIGMGVLAVMGGVLCLRIPG